MRGGGGGGEQINFVTFLNSVLYSTNLNMNEEMVLATEGVGGGGAGVANQF